MLYLVTGCIGIGSQGVWDTQAAAKQAVEQLCAMCDTPVIGWQGHAAINPVFAPGVTGIWFIIHPVQVNNWTNSA